MLKRINYLRNLSANKESRKMRIVYEVVEKLMRNLQMKQNEQLKSEQDYQRSMVVQLQVLEDVQIEQMVKKSLLKSIISLDSPQKDLARNKRQILTVQLRQTILGLLNYSKMQQKTEQKTRKSSEEMHQIIINDYEHDTSQSQNKGVRISKDLRN